MKTNRLNLKRVSLRVKLVALALSFLLVFALGYYVHGTPTSSPYYLDSASESYSYLLWRDGSTYCSKSGSTGLVTSGSDASTIILSTINSLPDAGGLISFKRAEYELDSAITIKKNAVYLQGEGYGRKIGDQADPWPNAEPTRFLATASMDAMITFGDDSSGYHWAEGGVSEIDLDGDGLVNHGVQILNAHSIRVLDCVVENFIDAHIYASTNIAGGISNIQIQKNLVRSSKPGFAGGPAIYFYGAIGESFIYENFFSCILYYGVITMGPGGNIDIHDNYFENIQVGPTLYASQNGTAIFSEKFGTHIHDNRLSYIDRHGIYITGTYSTISNNIISDVNQEDISGDGINVEGTGVVLTISGNIIGSTNVSPAMDFGIRFAFTGNATVIGNQFSHWKSNPLIITGGGKVILEDNYGFTTELGGRITASNDDYIAFGATFPNSTLSILLTVAESDANYIAQVKGNNATHFQLYLYDLTAGATETSDKWINWYAEWKP